MSITPVCSKCGQIDFGTGHVCKVPKRTTGTTCAKTTKPPKPPRPKRKQGPNGNPLVGVRVPVALLGRLDEERGDMSRQDKIREILEKALG